MVKNVILYGIVLILLTPLLMWFCWIFEPKEKLVIAIVDKTVLDSDRQEHVSLNWILNYQRYGKTSDKLYKSENDYFGFFPLEDEKFELKGLEQFSSPQLRSLSRDADLAFFTDTYGIYNNEWFKKGDINAQSGLLYGGLSTRDIEFLENMKEQKKLILTEFNVIGSPTQKKNRNKFESLFGIHWTGWTGRYFESLDPIKNQEIPGWLMNGYKRMHDGKWPFTKSGVVLVNDTGAIVILEEGRHLSTLLPSIVSTTEARENLGLPEKMAYPFWFDIIEVDDKVNKVNASYKIDVNKKGQAILAAHHIPSMFPAVSSHKGEDYDFYYFSGDFSDNPINMSTSYFKGVGFFKRFFYDEKLLSDRGNFFWNFYRPMITNILEEYTNKRKILSD